MKNFSILIVLFTLFLQHSAQQTKPRKLDVESPFSKVVVKKQIDGKVCDTCGVDFALDVEADFSYVITGTGHTPRRFYALQQKLEASYIRTGFSSSLHFISPRHIGIIFLPNQIIEGGKRLQLYRNFLGEDFGKLEYMAQQNGKVIQQWMPLHSLGESRDYAVMGQQEVSGRVMEAPWKRVFYAGDYDLDVNDSLHIMVRNISTKKVVKSISILRALDMATDFIYYQMPLTGGDFSSNLQNILNTGSGKPVFLSGKSSKTFEKDYGSIGILRFGDLGENEELQYSPGDNPYTWQSVRSLDPRGGLYLVLSAEMPEGKNHDIYLRYSSQPETVNKITIKVKRLSFQMPWLKIAIVSILLLIAVAIWFYLRNRRNRRTFAALKRKSEDTDMHLSLLSGQLNPHFLFNSLNAIQGTINENNPDKANAHIGRVATFMRDVMNNGRKEFVSLMEELKIEEDYLRLEQERMSFSYLITVAPEISTPLIDLPPLLLQPILENSIRHAFGRDLVDPEIAINVYASNSTLVIEVCDNGNTSWDIDGTGEGHGLSLTKKRIAVYNEKLGPMSIQMVVKNIPGFGTITTFTFHNWLHEQP